MPRSFFEPARVLRLGIASFHLLLVACAGTTANPEPPGSPSAPATATAPAADPRDAELEALRASLARAERDLAEARASLASATRPLPGPEADGGSIAALLDRLGPDVRRYNEHITTLSNPFFEGRAPGTDGGKRATDYLQWQFKQLGLLPAFPDEFTAADGSIVSTPNSSFLQAVPFGRQLKITRGGLAYHAGETRVELTPETDFTLLAQSANAEVTAPLAFAGYSVASGHDGYASYAGDNLLEGKVAIVLRFEPMNEEGRSLWASSGWSSSASLDAKLRAAARQGARAIIFVNPPGAADPRAGRLMSISDSDSGNSLDIPVLMLSTQAADALVRAADPDGRSLLDLRRLADAEGGVIDLPGVEVSLAAELTRGPLDTSNVGAVLPGKGALKEEFIVIGAHYDHVGFGYTGTSSPGRLHPGADDNASGTSGMLLAAEKLTARYAAAEGDARSILFLAFTAEEAGLIGSRHFVRNPGPYDGRMVFMLNMDMIGRLRDYNLELGGTETAVGLEDWLAPFIAASPLKTRPSSIGGGRSDHASFISGNIPALFFFSGLHREYHTPQDFAHLINREGAVEVVNFATEIAQAMATRREPWTFARRGQSPRRGAAPAAEPPAGDQPAPAEPAPVVQNEPADDEPPRQFTVRVRFGIMPGDYSEATRGVLIADVTSGTSADQAGLRAGDIITKWNGTEVKTVEEWMPLLAAHAPGDEVEITYVRAGTEQTTRCTLQPRR